LDYFVFLHDQLAANEAELREIFNEGGKRVISSRSAARLVKGARRQNSARPLDEAIMRIEEWGMKVTKQESGGSVHVQVHCPYAAAVHPLRSSEHPVCPLGEYFWGALQTENRAAILTDNALKADGAEFQFTL
jgi:hypothetical protein